MGKKGIVTKEKVANQKKAPSEKKCRHTFAMQAEPGSIVSVAGCFNDWCPHKQVLKDKNGDGDFRCTVMLPPGVYQYKFLVNDSWCIDPVNPNFVPNFAGSLNSVLELE